MKEKVLLGLSGGVDSAVSALLLQEAGFEVVGVYMKLHENDDFHAQNYDRACRVGEFLGVDVHFLDASDIFKKEIYDVGESAIHKILKKLDNENAVVFLFGHNPDLNMLAEEFVGFDENIPTCGVVEIAFNCEKWRDISSLNAEFISFDYPKRYKEA